VCGGAAITKLLIPSVVAVLGVSRPEMSLAGDSRNCMAVIDQVNWRQSMPPAFVHYHGELVLDPLANWQPMKVAEHRSDVIELSCARHPAAAF